MDSDRKNGNRRPEEQLRKGMIPDWLDDIFLRSVIPVIREFAKARINPNWITILAFLLTIVASWLIVSDRLIVAAVTIVIAGILDFSDGKVAALTGRITRFGSILDSTLDRYSDTVVYLALIVYYAQRDQLITSFAVILALVGSTMTSYLMTLGRSHGYEFRIGLLRRQDRVTLISLGLLLTFAHSPIESILIQAGELVGWTIHFLPVMPLTMVIYFLAIFANYTALQRFLLLRQLARESDFSDIESGKEVPEHDLDKEESLKEKQMNTLYRKVGDISLDRHERDEPE